MNKKIRVLYKKTGKAPVTKFITDMLEIKKMIIKGDLDLVKYENCIIVCNAKNKKSNKIPNIVLDFKHIAGDFFLIGYNPKIKDFRGLSLEEIIFYTDSLQRKSFQYEEYEKWIKKQNIEKENNSLEEYQILQEDLIQKFEKEDKNISTEKANNDMLEMILNIQAFIMKYVKRKMDGEQ